MKDIMFDLETMGVRPTSMILQIGACYFDRDTGKIGKTFSVNVLHPFWDWRFTSDIETIKWWQEQSEEAYNAVWKGEGIHIDEALAQFALFLRKGKYLWSHATFDAPIISNAFEVCRVKNPIHYRDMRDIRTLMDLAEYHSTKERKGIHHNALDDSIFQAEYVSEALIKLKNEKTKSTTATQ